jgi:hypothetical protein
MASSASRAVRLWAHVIRPLPRALMRPALVTPMLAIFGASA